MSTYEDHLDDMPIEGYAWGQLRQDNASQFLLQMAGHAANYAARGTFGTTEQFSLYSTMDSRWRDYLPAKGGATAKPNNPAELSLDFCEPSQMQMAMMTRWQLLLEDPDGPVLWVAKGAPRRWFVPANATVRPEGQLLFSIKRAPTRFGLFSAEHLAVPCPADASPGCEAAVQVRLLLQALSPTNAGTIKVFVRVRSAAGNASIDNVSCGDRAAAEALPSRELVGVSISSAGSAGVSCVVTLTA